MRCIVNDGKIQLMYIQKLLYLLDRLVSDDIFLDFLQQFKYSEKLSGRRWPAHWQDTLNHGGF